MSAILVSGSLNSMPVRPSIPDDAAEDRREGGDAHTHQRLVIEIIIDRDADPGLRDVQGRAVEFLVADQFDGDGQRQGVAIIVTRVGYRGERGGKLGRCHFRGPLSLLLSTMSFPAAGHLHNRHRSLRLWSITMWKRNMVKRILLSFILAKASVHQPESFEIAAR